MGNSEWKSADRIFGLDRESRGFDDAAVRFETDGEALPDIARLKVVMKATDQPWVAGGFLMKNRLNNIRAILIHRMREGEAGQAQHQV